MRSRRRRSYDLQQYSYKKWNIINKIKTVKNIMWLVDEPLYFYMDILIEKVRHCLNHHQNRKEHHGS